MEAGEGADHQVGELKAREYPPGGNERNRLHRHRPQHTAAFTVTTDGTAAPAAPGTEESAAGHQH
ncbi:hypothetical protein [Kitasatospora aureofaciens]|uniref:hypothetical protein n=1 Tax=Kitasatospora aureofaciens TaxID=1894 RepID=UPI0036F454DE